MAKLSERKVALVTGGGSGIGRASALAFAREGAAVVIADLLLESARETSDLVAELGGESLALECDVAKSVDVQMLIERTISTYGRLDYAFNNAGIPGPVAPLPEWSEEQWDQTCLVNLKGVWLCMKYEIPQMLKLGRGVIVNSSSISGLVGCPGLSGYTASKHGVVGITKCVALEYATQGIRVNAVCPSTIRTPLIDSVIANNPEMEDFLKSASPMGRIGTAEEVANTVLWLCSDAASYMTGLAVPIDGGVYAK